MGFKTSEWASHIPITGPTKAVLLALAHKTDDKTLECFPGQATLAVMAGVSRASVGRGLATLEEMGVISRERRRLGNTRYRTSDIYLVNTAYSTPEKNAPENVADKNVAAENVADRAREGVTQSARMLLSDGVVVDQSDDQSVGQSVVPAIDLDALFDEAWKHWPKKVDRKDALAKFKIVARAKDPVWLVAQIIAHGDAHAAHTPPKFVRGLTVWLNKASWDNPLAQPDAADVRKPTGPERNLAFVHQLAQREAARGREIAS